MSDDRLVHDPYDLPPGVCRSPSGTSYSAECDHSDFCNAAVLSGYPGRERTYPGCHEAEADTGLWEGGGICCAIYDVSREYGGGAIGGSRYQRN